MLCESGRPGVKKGAEPPEYLDAADTLPQQSPKFLTSKAGPSKTCNLAGYSWSSVSWSLFVDESPKHATLVTAWASVGLNAAQKQPTTTTTRPSFAEATFWPSACRVGLSDVESGQRTAE